MGPKGSGGRAVPEYFLIWKSGWMLWLYSSSLVALLRREEAYCLMPPNAEKRIRIKRIRMGDFRTVFIRAFFFL